MPYSITTKDGITIQGIPDDVSPDAPELKARVAKIRASGGAEALAAPEKPGLMARAADVVTGSLRRTAETDALPDWAGMPELNSLSMASAKTGLGTLLANPAETVKIIQANFPGAQSRQDEKGNFIIRSGMDGKEYAIKPGFAVSDIPRAIGALAAFAPAGRATSIAGAGAAGAATQAVIEGTQAATGGDFNPGDVLAAGALGAAVPAVVAGVKAALPPVRAGIAKMTGRPAPVAAPAAPAAPVAPAAMGPEAVAAASPDELAQTARTAALGGFGSKKATATLAAEAAPDAATLEAAQRLGIVDHLQPDHYTTNQAYRQLAQLVKSQTGSAAAMKQKEGLLQASEVADSIVTKLGGTSDLSALNDGLRTAMRESHDTIKAAAKSEYDKVAAAVPRKAPTPADNVLGFITQRADDLGGAEYLSQAEKTILARLSPKEGGIQPTYTLLDQTRKDLSAIKYGQAEPAFAGADDRLRDSLLSSLRLDQEAAANAHGVGDVWNTAQALASQYKGIQQDMAALFGKQLDRSIAGGGTMGLPGAVRVLAKGDADRLVRLLSVVPQDMRQQVAASGLSTALTRSAKGGELNWGNFSAWWDGLQKNQQAYNALMVNLPKEARQQLADLARVSKGVAMAKGEFIATGKALNPKALEAADSLSGAIFDEVKRRGVSGLAAEALGSTAGVPGLASALQSSMQKGKPSIMEAADKLITSPEFVRAVRTAGTSQETAGVRALARSGAFSRFIAATKAPQEFGDRERWIRQALQAAQQRQGQQPTQQPAQTVH